MASVGLPRGRMDVPRGLGVTQVLSVLESSLRKSQGRMLSVDSERVDSMVTRDYQHSPRSCAPHSTRSENSPEDASRSH